jgi:CheY-like chemotaxis protein/nitrogen-specific signal transduction histidine kinase
MLFVSVFRDSTQRRATEEALLAQAKSMLQAKVDAEGANNAKSHFLAAVSHDLRQPLAALTLYVDLLDPNAPEAFARLVPRIKSCSNNLGGLLGALLDLSKLQAGAIVPTLTNISMTEVLGALESVHAARATQKGLRLRVRPCALTIRTDSALLRRLLGNLVANAVQYTNHGGVLIACRLRGQRQWLEVYDSGIGIAEDEIASMFGEFSQLAPNGVGGGSGLGLFIVAKTAELLGIQVRVRSIVGRGSMFAVELPIAETILATDQSATLPAVARLRVALVDDNVELLKALTLALEKLGHEVVAATTGMEVIARLASLAPDLIITDYHLADGDTGEDVIEDARAIYGEALPALIITADTDTARLSKMDQEGIAVLLKPVQMDALRAAMAQVAGQD